MCYQFAKKGNEVPFLLARCKVSGYCSFCVTRLNDLFFLMTLHLQIERRYTLKDPDTLEMECFMETNNTDHQKHLHITYKKVKE